MYTQVSFVVSIKTVFINCGIMEITLVHKFAELDNHLLQQMSLKLTVFLCM